MHKIPKPLFLPTVFPPPEDDEALIGFLWRSALFSSRRRIKGHMQHLLGRQTLQPPWLVPCNLSALCARLAPALGTPQDALARHTCLPAYLPFVSERSRAPVLDHVLNGSRLPGVAARVGLASAAIRSKPRLALCPDCVAEDIRRLGFSYWRRAHVVGAFGVCPVHARTLMAGCGLCVFSQPLSRFPRLPQLSCWCGQRHREADDLDASDVEVLVRMGQMAAQLLDGALVGRNRAQIGAWMCMRASEAGYAGGLHMHTPRMVADLRELYSPAVLSRLNAELPSPHQNWLAGALGSATAPLVLGRNLLLFDFLGGVPDADGLERASRFQREPVHAPRRQPSLDEAAQRRMINRAELIGHWTDNPGTSRSRLAHACSGAVLWARRNDRAWYEATFPAVAKNQPRLGSRGVNTSLLDKRAATHVHGRHQSLLAGTGQPMQLTRAVLLHGTARANMITTAALGEMPLTSAALRACVEPQQAYRERHARWILVNQADAPDRLQRASRSTGLPLMVVDRLNRSLHRRPK